MTEAPSLPEFAKLQLQQSVETLRVQVSLLVQICTVLVLGDATVVGYAIQQRLAGVMWAGLIFPLAMRTFISFIMRLTVPIAATAVQIETEYREPGAFGLVSTFLAGCPRFAPRCSALTWDSLPTQTGKFPGARNNHVPHCGTAEDGPAFQPWVGQAKKTFTLPKADRGPHGAPPLRFMGWLCAESVANEAHERNSQNGNALQDFSIKLLQYQFAFCNASKAEA